MPIWHVLPFLPLYFFNIYLFYKDSKKFRRFRIHWASAFSPGIPRRCPPWCLPRLCAELSSSASALSSASGRGRQSPAHWDPIPAYTQKKLRVGGGMILFYSTKSGKKLWSKQIHFTWVLRERILVQIRVHVNLCGWIRIRIQNGGQKLPTKIEKNTEISCFEVLDVLFWGLKASPVA